MPATIEATIRATIMELLGQDRRPAVEDVPQAVPSSDAISRMAQPTLPPLASVEARDLPPSHSPVLVLGAQPPEERPEEGLKVSERTKNILADVLKDRNSPGKP